MGNDTVNKKTIGEKIKLIITGCQTREQLNNARTYLRNYIKRYGDDHVACEFKNLIKDVDEQLFPLSQRPI